jgi:hypothetical protein
MTQEQKVIRVKVGVLELAKQLATFRRPVGRRSSGLASRRCRWSLHNRQVRICLPVPVAEVIKYEILEAGVQQCECAQG